MACASRDLATAEIAYSAINEVTVTGFVDVKYHILLISVKQSLSLCS